MASLKKFITKSAGVSKIFRFVLALLFSDNGFTTNVPGAPETTRGKNVYSIKLIPCDINYLNTYEIKLLAGRWFFFHPKKIYRDSANRDCLLMKKQMARALGYTDPADALGKKNKQSVSMTLTCPLLGVTGDFHTTSLHKSIQPNRVYCLSVSFITLRAFVSMLRILNKTLAGHWKQPGKKILPGERIWVQVHWWNPGKKDMTRKTRGL